MGFTVLAGTNHDLEIEPEQITLNFLLRRWNAEREGWIPGKNDMIFSLQGWSGRKSYQISIEPASPPLITNMDISVPFLKYNDPMLVHVWMLKNQDYVPPQMHHITQRIEQIVLQNGTDVGYGMHAILLTEPFSAVELRTGLFSSNQSGFPNQVEISLWHSTCVVELLYFRVASRDNTTKWVRATKTHKYDIEQAA